MALHRLLSVVGAYGQAGHHTTRAAVQGARVADGSETFSNTSDVNGKRPCDRALHRSCSTRATSDSEARDCLGDLLDRLGLATQGEVSALSGQERSCLHSGCDLRARNAHRPNRPDGGLVRTGTRKVGPAVGSGGTCPFLVDGKVLSRHHAAVVSHEHGAPEQSAAPACQVRTRINCCTGRSKRPLTTLPLRA